MRNDGAAEAGDKGSPQEAIVEALRQALGDAVGESRAVPVDETWVPIAPKVLRDAVEELQRCGVRHLSTISGLDDDEDIVLLYHFWRGHGLTLSLRLPYQAPAVSTLVDLIPGAAFYEREVAEMLGVRFVGHEDIKPLLLPEDWDAGPPLCHHSAGALPPSGEDG
jgi:NADH:ubiquinone oxidoreductase subunit C